MVFLVQVHLGLPESSVVYDEDNILKKGSSRPSYGTNVSRKPHFPHVGETRDRETSVRAREDGGQRPTR